MGYSPWDSRESDMTEQLTLLHCYNYSSLRNSDGLVQGDDPQRCYGEGGGRGVHVWERM